jgi:hypothetical protein
MPRKFDKVPVHKQRFEIVDEDRRLRPSAIDQKEAANLYYDGLLQIEAQQAAEAMVQQQQAEQLGMNNAAKPQGFRCPTRRSRRRQPPSLS